MNVWKTLTEERCVRKWPNWSAHIAWGACIVLAIVRVWPLWIAVVCSISAGVLWEMLVAWLSPGDDLPTRASVVDWGCWIGGALVAMAYVVWVA